MSQPNFILSAVALLLIAIGLSGTNAALASPSDQPHANFQNKWAVIVGINKFQDKSWNLRYGEKDATDFKNYLVRESKFSVENVRVLTGKNATQANVSELLFSWLPSVVKPQDLVLIYIRSRGTLPSLDCNRLTYISVSDTDPDHLSDTALEMTAFPRHVLDKVHGAATIIIADADFSGVMVRTTGMSFPGGPSQELLPSGCPFQIICSASRNEISWESKACRNSVFTRRLIDLCRESGDAVMFPDVINLASKQVVDEVRESRNRQQYPEAIGMVIGASPISVLLAKPVESKSE
jgi:uncharacterized caspase-like protein